MFCMYIFWPRNRYDRGHSNNFVNLKGLLKCAHNEYNAIKCAHNEYNTIKCAHNEYNPINVRIMSTWQYVTVRVKERNEIDSFYCVVKDLKILSLVSMGFQKCIIKIRLCTTALAICSSFVEVTVTSNDMAICNLVISSDVIKMHVRMY